MLAAADIRLTEETVRELRAEGRQDRAAALEAVLTAAMAAASPEQAHARGAVWTLQQAAKSTGQSAAFIRTLIETGRLTAIIHNGQTLVQPAALWSSLDSVAHGAAAVPPSNDRDLSTATRRRAFIEAGLPREKRERVEQLHQQLEEAGRLSRTERAELSRLERELLSVSGNRLAQWTRQAASGQP